MTTDSLYEEFETLLDQHNEYFKNRETSDQRPTTEDDKKAIENYKRMYAIGVDGVGNPKQVCKLANEVIKKECEKFQLAAASLMHDELFLRDEVMEKYMKLQEMRKNPLPEYFYSNEDINTEWYRCRIHWSRIHYVPDTTTITPKQSLDAMNSLIRLLQYVIEQSKQNDDHELSRNIYICWLIYYYKWTKEHIEYIIRNSVGTPDNRKQLLNYCRIMKEEVERWVPLSYRIFGLPCGIDGGPRRNEMTDFTMMKEDVESITQFFKEREHNHLAMRGLSKTHLVDKTLQEDNPDFPATALFRNMKEVRELLTSRYTSRGNNKIFHNYRCASLLTDRENRFIGNGVVFIYLTGHGLSADLAHNLNSEFVNLGDMYSRYKGYLVAQPGHGRVRTDEFLEAGHIIAFAKFIGIQDFILEFLEVCRKNQVEDNEDLVFVADKDNFTQRHLIIVVDACYSGNWIQNNIVTQFDKCYIENTQISITIQTSTSKDLPSYGYFFTPLFVKLQTMEEQELNDLVKEYGKLTDTQKCELVSSLEKRLGVDKIPLPCLCHYKLDENRKLHEDTRILNSTYVKVQKLRCFADPNFFAFFAQWYFKSALGPDIMDYEREPLKERPLLNSDGGKHFLEMFVNDNKMDIKGIKLKSFERDGTPLCIVAIHSTTNTFEGQNAVSGFAEYWYHLHIHFDGVTNGKMAFPGKITHLKLVYAVQSGLRYCANGTYEGEVFQDASNDDRDDYQQIEQSRKDSDPLKRNSEFFIDDWKLYQEKVRKRLEVWINKQNERTLLSNGEKRDDYLIRDIWSHKKLWNKLAPVQYGPVLVRSRSRHLITKEIPSSNMIERITSELKTRKYLRYNPYQNQSSSLKHLSCRVENYDTKH